MNKPITLNAFKAIIAKNYKEDGKEDLYRNFYIKGGRGMVITLHQILSENFKEKDNNLENYNSNKVFLPGWGFFTFEHEPKFDHPKEYGTNKVSGLPEYCFEGELYYNEESLCSISALMENPYENVNDIIKKIKSRVNTLKEDMEELQKELEFITINQN